MIRDYWPWSVLIVGILVAIAVMIPLAHRDYNAWVADCTAKGGRVTSQTHFGTGVSAKGQPVTTTSVSYLCLTADGRILDSR